MEEIEAKMVETIKKEIEALEAQLEKEKDESERRTLHVRIALKKKFINDFI